MNHTVKVSGIIVTAQFAVEVICSNMLGYNPRRLVGLEIMYSAGTLNHKDDILELQKQRRLKHNVVQMSESSLLMGEATVKKFITDNIKKLDFKNYDIN